MIDPRIDKAREYLAGIYSPSSAVISDLLAVIAERDAEVERLRSYRSLPDGYVWQDYYSPDDVIKIRESLEAERDDAIASANDWADNYATAAAERDEARAAIREARTIRTVEQMAELPEETAVAFFHDGTGEPFGNEIYYVGAAGLPPGFDEGGLKYWLEGLHARVLYRPDDEGEQ